MPHSKHHPSYIETVLIWSVLTKRVYCIMEARLILVQALARDMQAAGGIVSAQDLRDAQPTVKQPLTAKVSMPACSD